MTVRIVNVVTRIIVGGPQQVSLLTAHYYRRSPDEPARRAIRAAEGIPDGRPVVSLVQRLSPPKTPHVFVRALPGILAERPDAVAWIVGDGPLRPAVEAAVAEAGVGGCVRFLGLRKDIPAVLSASDVLERVPAANAPAFVERLRTQAVDLLVSLACPQILRRDVLSVPPRGGAINLHGALLPDYRGLLAAFWVFASGEPHTGATVHYMHEEVDLGPVILQERVPIRPEDTVHTLVQRTKLEVGGPLLVRTLEQIEQGTAAGRPTDPRAGRAFGYPDADAIRRFRARGRRFV